ncbi:MAG: holo-ACP synthase [Clostridiales bacterium]|nr:holo-ACP synthase [Clostridiales bacterium]
MITGVGIDIVEIARVGRALRNPRFAERLFTAAEREQLVCHPRPECWAAGRFAAKEAVAKALGCGLAGCPPGDVEILPGEKGAPAARLLGETARRYPDIRLWVSISHNQTDAVAQAVAERSERHDPDSDAR